MLAATAGNNRSIREEKTCRTAVGGKPMWRLLNVFHVHKRAIVFARRLDGTRDDSVESITQFWKLEQDGFHHSHALLESIPGICDARGLEFDDQMKFLADGCWEQGRELVCLAIG